MLPPPPHPHTLDLSAQHCELCCLRPFCASLSGLCSLPLGSPEEGRVTAQDRLSGVLGLGEPDEAQLGWNSCRSQVPALTVLSGRSCSVMSARAQQQALGAVEGRVSPGSKQGGPRSTTGRTDGDQGSGTDGAHGEEIPWPDPCRPSCTPASLTASRCCCRLRCFPRAEGWGQAPLTGGTGVAAAPQGWGSPSFTFCLFLLPVCSSPPALLHPSCTRCAAHRREELGVLPASL